MFDWRFLLKIIAILCAIVVLGIIIGALDYTVRFPHWMK